MKAWAYKDFKIGILFTAQTGDVDLQQKDINGSGEYFINSGVEGLGIKGKTDKAAKVFDENTITIDFWGNAYYRDFKYKLATHNHVFSLSGEVIKNRSIGLYLVSAMSYMTKLFSYNNMGTWSKIKEQTIQLPVKKSGEIDYAFMQARIQEMEQARIQEMDTYLKVTGFENCELTEKEIKAISNISSIKTSLFKIGDLYNKVEIEKRPFDKRKNSRQIPDAKYCIPLVNAKHGDNGIMYYGDSDVFASIEMSIDIVQNGAVATGDVYPQPQKTGVLWDAYLIKASRHVDTVETLLYFSTAIKKSIKKKYTYDNKAYWEQVKEDIISLPVTASGEIDYQFMEIYIRAQEKLAIQRIKNWRAKEIEATKDIVNVEPNQPIQESIAYLIISSSDVAPSQRYITHLPVYPLRAACGYFDENGSLPDEEAEGWVDVSAQMSRLDKSMFIVHAEGRSMEPMIYDGDLCVFSSHVVGTRQGKIVLAKAKDSSDSSAYSHTIKKYSSEKLTDEDGVWHHTHVTLSPLNPEFQPIELDADEAEEGEFGVYGELVKVIDNF